MNFFYDTDEETTARISGYRDNIYDHVVDRFRELIADDAMDSALALADEFYEWMHPDHSEEEPTIFFNEQELRERYIQLTNGWWVLEYIKAQNEKRFADAEVILHEINTMRKLCDDHKKQ